MWTFAAKKGLRNLMPVCVVSFWDNLSDHRGAAAFSRAKACAIHEENRGPRDCPPLLNRHSHILDDLTEQLIRLSRLPASRLLTSLLEAERGVRRTCSRSARGSNLPQSASERSFFVVLCTVHSVQIVQLSCRSLPTGLDGRDGLSGWLALPRCAFGSNYTATPYWRRLGLNWHSNILHDLAEHLIGLL
jgi:hypothetical protein